MESLILWTIGSILILLLGILALRLLVNHYKNQLLPQFRQKVVMTLGLGVIYLLLFFLLNGVLFYWVKFQSPHLIYTLHVDDIWPLIQANLAFFVLNAFLLLALRSLIKNGSYL